MWILLLYAVAAFAQGSPIPGFPGDDVADRDVINSDEDFPDLGSAEAGEDVSDSDLFDIDFSLLEESSDGEDDNGETSTYSDSRLDLSTLGISSTSESLTSSAIITSPSAYKHDTNVDDTPLDLSMFDILSDDHDGDNLISDSDAPSYLPLTGLSQSGIGDNMSDSSDVTAESFSMNADDASFDFSSFGPDLDDSDDVNDHAPPSVFSSDDTGVDLSQFGISGYQLGTPDDTDNTDDSSIDLSFLSSFGIDLDGDTTDDDNDDSNGMPSHTMDVTSDIDFSSLGIGNVVDGMSGSIDSSSEDSFDLSQFGIRSEDHAFDDPTVVSLLNQRGLGNGSPSIDLTYEINSGGDSGDNNMGDTGSSYSYTVRDNIIKGFPFISETTADPTKQQSIIERLPGKQSESLPLEKIDASVIPVSTGGDPTPSLSSPGIALPESAINVNDIIWATSSKTAEPSSAKKRDTLYLDLKPFDKDLSRHGLDLILKTSDVRTKPQSTPSEQQNTASPEVEYDLLLDTTREQSPPVPRFDVIKTEIFDWTSPTPDHGSGIPKPLKMWIRQ